MTRTRTFYLFSEDAEVEWKSIRTYYSMLDDRLVLPIIDFHYSIPLAEVL